MILVNGATILLMNDFKYHQAILENFPVELCFMNFNEKIKFMRQLKGWSQEDMATKLDMSVNGYSNIERGETDVQISRLQQIAEVLETDLLELLSFGERNVFLINSSNYSGGENNHFSFNGALELQHELEKAQLIIK